MAQTDAIRTHVDFSHTPRQLSAITGHAFSANDIGNRVAMRQHDDDPFTVVTVHEIRIARPSDGLGGARYAIVVQAPADDTTVTLDPTAWLFVCKGSPTTAANGEDYAAHYALYGKRAAVNRRLQAAGMSKTEAKSFVDLYQVTQADHERLVADAAAWIREHGTRPAATPTAKRQAAPVVLSLKAAPKPTAASVAAATAAAR